MKIFVFSGVFMLLIFTGPVFSAEPSGTSVSPMGSSEPQQMLDFNLAGYGAKGQKTWEVQGGSMDMQGNDVKINDITAHMYGVKDSMVVTADHGSMDKANGIVYLTDNVRAVADSGAEMNTDSLSWAQKEQRISTDDQVHITKDNMTASAKGLEANPDFKVAKFGKDVQVTLDDKKEKVKKDSSQSPGIGFGTGRVVITCEGPMELNYEKNTAVFEKNVKVEGDSGQGTMFADKMTIIFSSEAKQIDKLVAQGNVKIVRGENTSYSDGLIFTGADKRLVLTGRPKLVMFPQEAKEEEKNVSP
jgi:LPS export ABC transporter protein LptC